MALCLIDNLLALVTHPILKRSHVVYIVAETLYLLPVDATGIATLASLFKSVF